MKKLYILGPKDGGEGIYYLLTDNGEGLASHLCSSSRFAKGDLEANRPERQKEWKEQFGEYEVLYADEMTKEKLIELNHRLQGN